MKALYLSSPFSFDATGKFHCRKDAYPLMSKVVPIVASPLCLFTAGVAWQIVHLVHGFLDMGYSLGDSLNVSKLSELLRLRNDVEPNPTGFPPGTFLGRRR